MATTIAVYYRFIMFVERIECFIEHRIHQRRVRACSYRPAYNLAIKAVDNRRQSARILLQVAYPVAPDREPEMRELFAR